MKGRPSARFWQIPVPTRRQRVMNLAENPCIRVMYAAMSQSDGKHRVLEVRDLGEGAFVVRFERRGLEFASGQYVHVGPLPGIDRREYSVYSSTYDDFLEILVKEVDESIKVFAKGAEQSDDITMLAMQFVGKCEKE